MIVTVTLNPSLDRTLEVESLDAGEVNRATRSRVEPGGKGVNVARALLANGFPSRAVLPLGGPEGEHLAQLLEALGLDVRSVAITAPTRTNVSLVEPNGTVTKVNAPGPQLSAEELASLEETTVASLGDADWVAACGSLPPGAPDDLYAQIVSDVHRAGRRIAVDTSGTPLAAVIDAGPDLIKPNDEELGSLIGTRPRTFADVVDAAELLRRRGVGSVLVSLGRHGAILVDDRGSFHAETPPLVPRSNVGAGDATLAGFLAAGGQGPEALRLAVAWGAAAVRLPGTAMPTPSDVRTAEVSLGEVERDRGFDDPNPEPLEGGST